MKKKEEKEEEALPRRTTSETKRRETEMETKADFCSGREWVGLG